MIRPSPNFFTMELKGILISTFYCCVMEDINANVADVAKTTLW